MPADQSKHSEKPFVEALAEILRERHGDSMGNFNLRPILSQAESYSYEALRLMLRGERSLTTRAIEEIAKVADVPPDYFIEYRCMWSAAMAQKYPKLADAVYELTLQFVGEGDESR